MNKKPESYPIVELRNLSSLEKIVVNCFLQLKSPISQATVIEGIENAPSQPTVSRAISSLIERGIVTRTGRTKGSRFALSPEARHFATSPAMRAPRAFDPFRIAAYIPNKTQWLPDQMRDRMVLAGKGMRGQLDASTYSQQISERFMINLSWASSHLEGNTYDFLDTEMLIRYGTEARGHDRSEVLMLLNHKRAISHMLEGIGNGIPDNTEVYRLHALMMNGLMDPGDVGNIRKHGVRISTSSYKPSSNPVELADQQNMIMTRAAEINDSFEASFFLLVATSYLQAFGDGNKRMGRLLSNIPLLEAGLPPLSFVNINRDGYILGLIDFYETSSTKLLADTISKNYALTAPHFEAAYFTQRIPRQIEITEGQRIAECIREIINDGITFSDIAGRVDNVFWNIEYASREEIAGVILEKLENLSPSHAVIYGLKDAEVARWIENSDPDLSDL